MKNNSILFRCRKYNLLLAFTTIANLKGSKGKRVFIIWEIYEKSAGKVSKHTERCSFSCGHKAVVKG